MMGVLEAVLEDALAKLPAAEWDALVVRVRGPSARDYPAKRRRADNPGAQTKDGGAHGD
jgi:hypothetical protein